MDPTFISLLSGVAGGALTKALDGPMKSLEDIWYSSIGYKTDKLRQIAELKNHDAIEKYKKGIVNETSKIPDNFLHEPELSIAGPALEASTYYVNDDSIRNMFEKLIASSMDSRKDNTTRASFVEIVKQMSSIDALFLKEFSKNPKIPIGELREKSKSGNYSIARTNIVLKDFNIDLKYRGQLPSTIDNLGRLGLINIDYSKWTANLDYNVAFKNTPEFIQVSSEIDKDNKRTEELINFSENTLGSTIKRENIDILKKEYPRNIDVGAGRLDITSFGSDFTSICLL